MIRLVQFSTPTCPPCIRNKAFIETRIIPGDRYEYVNLREQENVLKYGQFLRDNKVRGVPFYALFDGDTPVEVWGNIPFKKVIDWFIEQGFLVQETSKTVRASGLFINTFKGNITKGPKEEE